MRDICRHIQGLLPYYADQALGASEAEEVRGHLAECAECRREAVEWEVLNRLVAVGLASEATASAEEIEIAVQRVRQVRPGWAMAPAPLRFWRRWAPAAVVAAAAVVLALAGAHAPIDLAEAPEVVRGQMAALAVHPGDLATGVPRDYATVARDFDQWQRTAGDRLAGAWDQGAAWSHTLVSRVGTAPLVTCLVMLLLANIAFAREAGSSRKRLHRG